MITLKQKIAQMLIMGFTGTTLESLSPVKTWIEIGLGGVILFDRDLKTNQTGKNLVSREQIQRLNHDLQMQAQVFSAQVGNDLPLLIAVDYEGGAVNRLRHIAGCPLTLSAEEYAGLPDAERIQVANTMASILCDLGFNLNFAPVVDLSCQLKNGIIGHLKRAFSDDPIQVARLAAEFVAQCARQGILCCYKHFPGHGSASGDTHEDFVDVSASFSDRELLPYAFKEEEQQPAMVMTAHVINRQLDADGLPATLSRRMLEGVLRNQLGFSGIIISDDLQMGAISRHYALDDVLIKTIHAGANMLIFGNQLGSHDALDIIERIYSLVVQKKITVDRIEDAWCKIKTLKKEMYKNSLIKMPFHTDYVDYDLKSPKEFTIYR